jgi:hypothetical protein
MPISGSSDRGVTVNTGDRSTTSGDRVGVGKIQPKRFVTSARHDGRVTTRGQRSDCVKRTVLLQSIPESPGRLSTDPGVARSGALQTQQLTPIERETALNRLKTTCSGSSH